MGLEVTTSVLALAPLQQQHPWDHDNDECGCDVRVAISLAVHYIFQ